MKLRAKNMRLPDDLWAAIEEYRQRIGAVTLAEAVRRLILAGIAAERRQR